MTIQSLNLLLLLFYTQGIESGYPTTTEYVVGKNSSYTDALKTSSLIGVMLTYAEEEFIKAELALKGFNTGTTAKAHYENGIAASISQWGAAMPAGYLAQPGVAYNVAANADVQLQQIMLQKYYAYFFVGYQLWFEKRRTGYPILPRGTGIPNGLPIYWLMKTGRIKKTVQDGPEQAIRGALQAMAVSALMRYTFR